ncbi:MAG: Phage capsid family protein [Firmicutes bacterium ADurb.Bin193]|nr:MAG: Phage capsid family protein [Firmicutes bacterium ADurb.Bin193]
MNKKLLAMMGKRNELKNQAQTLLDTAGKENRPLTDDEKSTLADLKSQISRWDDTISEMADMLEDSAPVDVPVNKADNPQPNNTGKFANLGEQLRAVYNAAQPNRPIIDERLMNSASGANESVPSDGGFLVQTDFASELLKHTFETGILAPRCKKIPISTNANALKINALDDSSRANGARWGGIQTYWENEADELVSSKPKFRTMDLSLKKLTGLCYATDELLQDAAALQSVITQGFAEEFGFKIDDTILNGNGSGQPLGILNSPALVTVAKETEQTSKITVENLIKMWSRCWGRSRANAVWYVNQEIEPLLYTLKIGDVPVYLPAGGLSEKPYATLFGRPIVPLEQCSALGSVGDIILGDMSQYLLIDKGGINTASSIHVRFLYDESVFRFIYRVDGQPIWNKPITPYKGSNTLSPFVTLAARS